MSVAHSPVMWALGIPPILPNNIYLVQGPTWNVPAVMRWKYSKRQATWYLYFEEEMLDSYNGCLDITDFDPDKTTYFLLYTYDENHDDWVDPTTIPAEAL